MKYRLKSLIKKPSDRLLMKYWQEVVKARAGYRCVICGKGNPYLNAHHIFSKSHRGTKYDPDNGLCLCSGHHSLNNDSVHKDPMFWPRAFAKGIKTQKDFEILERRAKTPAKCDPNLELIALKSELKKYDNTLDA